jgi:hypothetical protein
MLNAAWLVSTLITIVQASRLGQYAVIQGSARSRTIFSSSYENGEQQPIAVIQNGPFMYLGLVKRYSVSY